MRAFLLSLAAGAVALPTAAAAAAETCGPAVTDAYRRGFTEGVAAVNAQLGAVTAQMQRDVQAQVNAQLAALDARRTAELEARLAEAQDRALADQAGGGVARGGVGAGDRAAGGTGSAATTAATGSATTGSGATTVPATASRATALPSTTAATAKATALASAPATTAGTAKSSAPTSAPASTAASATPSASTTPPPTMPTLPPLTVAPGGAIVPVMPALAGPGHPTDPAALPSGTTLTITDPQNLPPDLYRALMAYAAR